MDVIYRRPNIRITYFLLKLWKGEESGENISNDWGEKLCQPKFLYPQKIYFRKKDKMKSFSETEKQNN